MIAEIFVILLLVILIVNRSHTANYYLKYQAYYGLTMIAAFLWIPYFGLRPRNVLNLLTAATVLGPITKLVGIKWEQRGAEHLAKDRMVIIVANHQTSFDILGMYAIWHTMRKTTVIAKKELLLAGTFGLAAWLCGLVFINKKSRDESCSVMQEAMEKLKVKKIKLWVFPEGTRRNTGEIHPFKKGAFHLAIESQVPILPVVFSSYKFFLSDEKRILNPGKVIVETLPAISTAGMTSKDVNDLMEKTRRLMIEKYEKNTAEIEQDVIAENACTKY